MFGLIKKMFIGSTNGLVNTSNDANCISLSNQKCDIQPTLTNLHPNELSQELRYSPFTINLDWCVSNCNGLCNNLYVPSKTEDSNLSLFNMITGKTESETSTKHKSC